MSSPQSLQSSQAVLQRPTTSPVADDARSIYRCLMENPSTLTSQRMARSFLKRQLDSAAQLPSSLPKKPEAFTSWVERGALDVAERYASYLAARKAGQPRRYFGCRSHALSFLQQVAPTKLVDGAWLYGSLQHWRDNRFYSLIRTYLEELGDGEAAQNHVLLYQRLLAECGCEIPPHLSDEHYLQGALQLALGHHSDDFIPELLGYNLGYEQLPLHLLITAFELNELQIDPYYFTLHVTIDNASSGHARKAALSVLATLPATGTEEFMQRVANGYRLNDLGLGSTAIIEAFDLEEELVDSLERKSVFGRQVHSDFCRIGGRTVNEWLSKPDRMRGFLRALEDQGWIKRGQNPQKSRFWRLIEGPGAQMFGVFSPYEKQLLHDWIANDWFGDSPQSSVAHTFRRNHTAARGKRSWSGAMSDVKDPLAPSSLCEFDQDLKTLTHELQSLPAEQRMQRLISLMSPSNHATPAGLLATRLFSEVIC